MILNKNESWFQDFQNMKAHFLYDKYRCTTQKLDVSTGDDSFYYLRKSAKFEKFKLKRFFPNPAFMSLNGSRRNYSFTNHLFGINYEFLSILEALDQANWTEIFQKFFI